MEKRGIKWMEYEFGLQTKFFGGLQINKAYLKHKKERKEKTVSLIMAGAQSK